MAEILVKTITHATKREEELYHQLLRTKIQLEELESDFLLLHRYIGFILKKVTLSPFQKRDGRSDKVVISLLNKITELWKKHYG